MLQDLCVVWETRDGLFRDDYTIYSNLKNASLAFDKLHIQSEIFPQNASHPGSAWIVVSSYTICDCNH